MVYILVYTRMRIFIVIEKSIISIYRVSKCIEIKYKTITTT
jgi:hypothetical protein